MSGRGGFRQKHGNCNKAWRKDKREAEKKQHDETASGSTSAQFQPNKGRPRPPPGLKGKEIGLWYRDNMVKKRKSEEEDSLNAIEVTLPEDKRDVIENLLLDVRAPGNANSDGAYSHINEGKFKTTYLSHIKQTFEESLKKLVDKKIEQVESIDNSLFEKLQSKQKSSRYQEMLEFREKLPTYKKRNEIVKIIEKNQIVVVSGETGCGKTTQVVQFILDYYISNRKGSLCSVVCTQPRRISAISVAERVAAERDEKLGDTVGYQIRLEKVLPNQQKGSILFVTTGVLLKWMQSNPALNNISHVFLDEIHERDVMCDFVITFLKYILPKRPSLKVILMSATLNAEHFSEYFGGVPCITIPGFTFPVEEIYLEQIVPMINFRFQEQNFRGRHGKDFKANQLFNNYVIPYIRDLEHKGLLSKHMAAQLSVPDSEKLNIDLMEALIQYICTNEPEGAILVFVPGLMQIQNLHKQIMNNRFFSQARHLIIPLHSIMPTTNQRQVFIRPPRGVRKIVIATSIAETSITIDDVVYVIDSGRNKMESFNTDANVSTLLPEWESVANSRQKRGRAGRVQPGKCYKLFTKAREELFEPFPLPEMQRTRLEEVVLQAKMLQLGRVVPFLENVMDPPDSKAVEMALQMLRTLNALDGEERLTPLGYHLARLPMDPQTGKMILMGAMFSCVEPVFAVAASLNFKDPFLVPLGKEKDVDRMKLKLSRGVRSDHFVLAEALRRWEEACASGHGPDFAWEHYLSAHTLRLLRDMTKQFAQHLLEMNFLASGDPKDPRNNVNSKDVALVKSIVCSGLYPNVAIMRRFNYNKLMLKTVDHPRAELHPKSLCANQSHFESPFFVYHKKLKSTAIFIHDVTMIYPMALLFFGERLDIIEEDHGKHSIRVDNMIKFKCFKKTARLVQKLRKHMEWILESAISNPEVISWTEDSQKMLVLKAIVELLGTEEKELHLDGYESDA